MKIRTCRYLNLLFRHFSFLKTQLVLLPLLLANVTQAQLEVLNCATSEMMQARPDLLKKQEELDELVLKHNKKGATSESKATPYVLPVVVHIIHNNGVENISDGQIIAAIEHLNQAFAHEGYYVTLGDGAITPVQFCLAKRDPDGNPTTGITRTESALTDVVMEFQDIQLKNLNRWDPTNYVNIWVTREISSFWNGTGVAGYAFFPSSHGQQEDGIVCEASWFGVSQAKDAVLIHEMGHYLGLYHTFQGGCSNEDCTVQGDKVCDTPPDRAVHTDCTYNSCNTDEAAGSPFTSDQFDFTGDFMDYSPFSCYYFFTSGQAERMQATIETTRSSLLDSDGCLGTCDMVITADFSVQPNSPAVGQTVSFINNTMGATEFSWLDNGLEFSQDTNPSYVFSNVGTHIIRMIANNTDLDCIEKVSIQVEVQCPIQAGFTPNTTVALAGSTLVFTNTSSGAPNLSYEWRINDQVVSSSLNMSHLFEATGSYSVTLKASGLGCSADTTVWVLINGPCGLAPEPVQKVFTSTQKPFVGRDILVLEDGTVVYCGAQKSKPMVAKWDGLGNLLWNKVLDNDGIFNQIEVLPDGSFILIGQADLKMVIAKIDGTGNFIWAKTLENTGSDYYPVQELNRMLAVNPDGSMGIYYSDNYDQKRYLVKISADGEILWAKRFNQIGSQASLRRATDGSGDFLLMSAGTFMTSSFSISIFRFNQTSGVALNGFLYYFPNEDMQYYSNLDLAVHPDGGFSAFWVDEKFPTGVDVYKHLARFSANGSVIWAKKYLLDAPLLLKTSSMRPLPNNKGWFFMDSRANSSNVDIGNFLQRIDSDGKLVWERKWSEPSYQTVNLVPTWQSNRVRGVASEGYLLDIKLINFQDGTTPMSCLPFETPNTEVENFHPKQSKLFSNVSSVTLQLQPLPINLLNYDLTGSTICAAVMPCPEICDNQIDDDGDFFIDCFDDDCHCAPIDTVECFVDYDMPEFAMKLGWQTKTGLQMFDTSTPLVGNLNPQFDSIPEVVMAGWSGVPNEANIYIYQGDGSDKDSPKTLAVPGVLSWQGPSQFTLADLDSDGVPELIALCSDQKIRIFTQFDPNSDPPMQLWATSVQATKYTKGMLSVADFDSDNVPEIYIGSQIFKLTLNPPNAPDLQLVLSGTAANGYSSAGTSLVSSTASDILSTAECFGDPDCAGLELVAGYSIYSVDLSTTDGDGLQIKEKYNLNSVDPSSLVYADGFAAVADINLDGSPEVVLNTRRGSGSSYSNGVAVWNRQGLQRFYATNDISGIYGSGGQILIANVFDDKKAGFSKNMPEIIVAGQYELFCFNQNKATQSPNSPFWWTLTTEEQSGRTSASAFDFNGDGMLEIAYRDEKNLRILYGGPSPFPFGVDEHRKWASFPLTSGTGDEYPVVADIDHDNQAEIVVSGIRIAPGTPNHGCISVFESDSRPWMPARSVWNQYNYFNVNINDDLTVPAVQQKHWAEAPIPGSGKRPYNTHLVQGTATDSVIAFREKVPDAQLFFETITCHFDSFELLLKICNQGSATLPPGTPISFYLGNPTTTAAPLLVPPINLPQALEKGACFDLNLMIPAAYNTEIFAIANDNGNLPQPFNLTADFPSTGQKECNYENNLISFIFQHNPPILDLGPNVLLCNNSVVELNAQTNFSSYRWHDGSAQSSFTAFSPGTYWVEAKDKCGFVQSDTIKIELNTTVALDLPNEQIVCEGELVHLAIPGFATYQWYPSDSVSCADCVEVDVVAAQSITIYLTASDGTCIVTDSVRVIKSPPPQVSLYVQHGDCDTPASITAQSGSEDYMFLWSNGATEAIIYPEEAAAYFVTISDAQGCIGVDSIAVQIVENDLSVSFQTSLIPCEGGPGIIQASGFGGSGQFAFVWSTTETTSIIEVFQPGDYYVTLTDLSGTGCTYVDTVSITTRGELELETTVTMVSCAGMQDAAVQVLPVDGVSPYTWLWQNGQTDTTLIGLSAGTYIVTVTDAIGCTGAGVVLITEPLSLLLDASADNLTLCSDGTTSVFALVEGGTPPYSFFWDNGQTDSLIIVATAGNYAVTLTDMRGCTAVDSVQIGSIPPFSILLDSLNHASGPTHADGSVFVHTSGGLSPFSYLWSNGDTTQNLTSVAPGNYSLTVTDGAGCTQMMLAEVGFGSSVGQLPAHGWDARIQPNPVRQGADSQLIIESISVQEVEVKLFDAIGRSLWKERFEWAGERFQQPIKTPATAGVYFVVLAGGRELKCLRWVVD